MRAKLSDILGITEETSCGRVIKNLELGFYFFYERVLVWVNPTDEFPPMTFGVHFFEKSKGF